MRVLLGYSVWKLKFINFLLRQRLPCKLLLPPAVSLWTLAAPLKSETTCMWWTHEFKDYQQVLTSDPQGLTICPPLTINRTHYQLRFGQKLQPNPCGDGWKHTTQETSDLASHLLTLNPTKHKPGPNSSLTISEDVTSLHRASSTIHPDVIENYSSPKQPWLRRTTQQWPQTLGSKNLHLRQKIMLARVEMKVTLRATNAQDRTQQEWDSTWSNLGHDPSWWNMRTKIWFSQGPNLFGGGGILSSTTIQSK